MSVSDSSATGDVPDLEILWRRAAIHASVRRFLTARGYLEVDTPIMGRTASMEPHLVSFVTEQVGPDGHSARTCYLHTSPEYAMKRLLGAHGVSIFQLARVFRNEEDSRTHHREFTLLEWYRVGRDYRTLMDETEALVRTVAREHGRAWPRVRRVDGDQIVASVDLSRRFERLTVREAFRRHARLDPWDFDVEGGSDGPALAAAARAIGCDAGDDWSWDDTFHLVLLERVEPVLGLTGRATLLHDYPPRLAALARVRDEPDGTRVAERFELYICGLELCNGFSELVDGAAQRARFEDEQRQRSALGRVVHAIDERLIAALDRCPPCTGNALGMDRLAMLLLECGRIDEVLMRD